MKDCIVSNNTLIGNAKLPAAETAFYFNRCEAVTGDNNQVSEPRIPSSKRQSVIDSIKVNVEVTDQRWSLP